MERKFLLPGEFYATRKPMELGTVLGSCVSICLRNSESGYASMNHFVLPNSGSIERHMEEEPGKYGETSCLKIIKVLLNVDPNPRNYTAQLFGGGNVTSHLAFGATVGTRNIEVAEKILDEHRLRVVRRELGGTSGRRITFNTATNEVECRLIQETDASKKVRQEREELASRDIQVLVVDDSATVRGVLRRAIDQAPGMRVVAEAADPYEAREMLMSSNPDVILLDIIMPRMNGLDFLKKLSQYMPKPVIIVSTIAKAGSDIARRSREYGAMDTVDKEKLDLYKGVEAAQAELVPKIRSALIRFKPPKPVA